MFRNVDERAEGGRRAFLQGDWFAGAWHGCLLPAGKARVFEIDLLSGHEPREAGGLR